MAGSKVAKFAVTSACRQDDTDDGGKAREDGLQRRPGTLQTVRGFGPAGVECMHNHAPLRSESLSRR